MIITAALNNALVTGTGTGEGGSGLLPEESFMLKQLWERQGLNPDNPLTADAVSGKISTADGSIDLDITGNGISTSTVTAR